MTTINTGYIPREPQRQIHKSVRDNRFTVVVAHRRMGKTVGAINQLIHSALNCELKNPRFALISPTYSQAKRIAWDMLTEYTRPLKAINNIAELRSDFMGRRISLYGADSIDALRGIYLDGVVIDEYAQINPSLFSEIIRPAIADRKGFVMFIGTPKGRNHFATLRDKAATGKDGWNLLEFKASKTGLVDQEELDAALKEMGEDKYSQEFEVNFHTPVEGAYYGTLINDLEFKQQINDSVIRDDICKTFVSWDLGMGDSTAIFVAQSAGQEIHIIDYLENHGQGLDYYINWLRDNRYDTAEQLLPHDIQVRELGTGKSRLEVLEEAGLNCRVVPKLAIDDGIQAVRRILPRCWFNTKVKDAVDLLRNYRRTYDEKRDVFYDKPLHDFTSHAADSFRYLAVGLNETDNGWDKPLEINKQWIV